MSPSTSLRMKPHRSALLIHGGALGDFLLALRLMTMLRVAAQAEVSILARGVHRPFAERAGIARFQDLETGGWHRLFTPDSCIDAGCAAFLCGIDEAVDMLGDEATKNALLRAGVRKVYTINPNLRSDWEGHIINQWTTDLIRQGFAPHPLMSDASSLFVSEQDRYDTGRRWEPSPATRRPVVTIHPGSGARAKCWPIEFFCDLVARLLATQIGVLLILGPVERDLLASPLPPPLRDLPAIECPTLNDLYTLLSAADAHVGNDSGVTHLAASIGAPVVALFGPTNPRHWAPLGPAVHLLHGNGPGRWPAPDDVFQSVCASIRKTRHAER